MITATIVPMGATTTSVSFRVLVLQDTALDPSDLVLLTEDRTVPLMGGWRSFDEGQRHLRYRNGAIDELRPGTSYEVTLATGGEVIATCSATTLPSADQPIGIVVGSCCADDGPLPDIKPNYRSVTRPFLEENIAPINIWCGDQVYVDAPWTSGFWRADPRRVILGKYLSAWGLEGSSGGPAKQGLAHAMAQGSNWFLPDDHEFWNGYPHPSFFTLPAHTAGRLAVQVYRRITNSKKPSHPASQWSWGRTAGEAYCAFQTLEDFETFDEDVNPPQVATIDLGNAAILLVDTRWHRTIRKRGKGAGFMRQTDLEALVEKLTSDDRLLCVALAKPLIGYLPHQGAVRVEAEYSPEDFVDQYTQLWAALRDRADKGWPTVILGGDVHRQSIKSAFDNRLLEVVSSPLAGLNALSKPHVRAAKWVWIKAKRGLRYVADRAAKRSRPNNDDGTAYPVVVGPARDGLWEVERGERPAGPDPLIQVGDELSSGLVSLRIDAADAERPRITVNWAAKLRDGKKGGPQMPVPGDGSHEFEWNGAWKTV